MAPHRVIFTLLLAAAAIALWPVAAAAESSQNEEGTPLEERTIADGVHADGLAVGGMTVREASERIAEARERWVARTIGIRVDGRAFWLTGERARVELEELRTAARAYWRGERLRSGDLDSEHIEEGEEGPTTNVDLVVRYSPLAVRSFVRAVSRHVNRRPRSARVRIQITRVRLARARVGRALERRRLEQRIAARYENTSLRRALRERTRAVRPRVTSVEAVRRNRTVITIDRQSLQLRLFVNLRHARTYSVALGRIGHSTPAGLYSITTKQVNPAWHAPNQPWAGEYAGTTVPGGHPENPLRARWLGIVGGVGIHGTNAEDSIGTRASAGCIRMRVPEVIQLYDRVSVGTPVRISR